MPITKVVTLYHYHELSEAAKDRARDWYRSASTHDEWWDQAYEDAATAADLLGIDIDEDRHGRGQAIYFSGFSSQGDGACWKGRYAYKRGAAKAIAQEFPQEPELHRIAMALQALQSLHFYKLRAVVSLSGRYCHSGTMDVDTYHSDDLYRDIGDAETEMTTLLRDFADWIYRELEKQHDWLNSDEEVAASIEANEYTFTETGERE